MMSETPARLYVQQGPFPNQEYLLTKPAIVMGRGPNNDIVFADPEVSRQHTQITLESDGRFFIRDLGSTNGTFVNGHRLNRPTLLNDGDIVSLGESIVLAFFLPETETADEDDTPTAEVLLTPAPAQTAPLAEADHPAATYSPPPDYND